MKKYKYLYQRMLDENIIRKAYKKLRKGKAKRKEIIAIDANLDIEVAAMQRMIENTKPPDVPVENPELAYKPCKRTPKIIFEHGKKRKIYMPEIHEQWLHHIIVLILEPIITATSYRYSCGSFPKRGAHYGKKFIMKILRSGKGIRNFGKIDIRHFYDNIRINILMKELAIRIKDNWFLYIIRLCLKGFKKGIPLGFYISQWLANYILEPLDKFITEKLGLDKFVRYMDDMIFYDNAKKNLQRAIAEIRIFIEHRYRLKLKDNYQVCRFFYESKKREIGRPLDFMGFQFYRNKVILRKNIMIAATGMAKRLAKAKAVGRGYYAKHVKSMLSYVGWFDCTNTYDCYTKYVKPLVNIGKLKKIVSKLDRRKNRNETVEKRTLQYAT
ncbi:RNA-directed DNA polymerase [Roseburia faecis]|uniref:RNA-directed DNA polymerase n=1 Tax=Roseburia faecis TaxID=301302 RepID=UPI001922BC3D|nr:RNA-directed DNA polymerase [Roseburia faecis]